MTYRVLLTINGPSKNYEIEVEADDQKGAEEQAIAQAFMEWDDDPPSPDDVDVTYSEPLGDDDDSEPELESNNAG